MNDDALTASKNVWSFKSNKCQCDVLDLVVMRWKCFFFFFFVNACERAHTHTILKENFNLQSLSVCFILMQQHIIN